MDDTVALKQARTIAVLLPALMRRLAGPDDDLVAKLPLAQLKVCGVLYGGPRRMSSLSRELGVSLSALTQIADRLESARLVKRVAHGSDRRVRYLQLTQRGERVMRLREDARTQRTLTVLERLPPKAREEVTAAVEALMNACTAIQGEDAAGRAAEAASSSVLISKAHS
jgi:DNA-binding MarR family transcriptional regulator